MDEEDYCKRKMLFGKLLLVNFFYLQIHSNKIDINQYVSSSTTAEINFY